MENTSILNGYGSVLSTQVKAESASKNSENNYTNIPVFNSKSVNNDVFEKNIENLNEEFQLAQDKQGFFGKLWDGFKNITGLGLSSDDVENKIKQYESGKITYDEAIKSIESFEEKQNGAVNIIANTFTGLATATLAVATGGIGAIFAGVLIGGATKMGIKTLDRATNNVQGDALDAKQLIKDAVSGAVDGAVSAATAGLLKAPVAGQAVKESIKQGVIQGAKAGAISGAATGAADYTIDVALEDDKEFEFDDLLITTAQNATAGAVFGGIFGGIGSGISQRNLNEKVKISHNAELGAPVDNAAQAVDYIENFNRSNPNSAILESDELTSMTDTLTQLSKKSEQLALRFDSQVDKATEQINKVFSDKTEIEFLTARAKSQKSIFSKLAKKSINGSSLSDMESCYDAIGDAVGIRLQMKSLDVSYTQEVVESTLKKNGINASFDDFIRYLNDDTFSQTQTGKMLSGVRDEIIDALKTKQSQNVVDQLTQGIKTGKIKITELNNYGSELTSYFTDAQIAQIIDAYDFAIANNVIGNDDVFKIVSQNKIFDGGNYDITDGGITQIPSKIDDEITISVKQKTSSAIKDSGYTSSQMNTKHTLSDGSVVSGELQIRGSRVNSFADVEHIPYDIRTGKISINDSRYTDIYKIIENMSDVDYANYNRYLSDTYKALRMKELGLLPDSAKLPEISEYINDEIISQADLSLLDLDGLIEISKRGH